MPQGAVKGQTLADFIAEWTDIGLCGEDASSDHWAMYFDGSYTLAGAGAIVVLIARDKEVLKYAIELRFPATNNIVEYEGLSRVSA